MKPLLNTLYVTTQGAYLARDGEAVAVRVEQERAFPLLLNAQEFDDIVMDDLLATPEDCFRLGRRKERGWAGR